MNRKMFVSGPLTGLENPDIIKANYDRLGQICDVFGMEPYIPHKHTDPIAHPDVPAQRVYEVDRRHIRTSSLVIAYVGIPSLGVGQEIEIARQHGVDVVLLCERGRPLSRMTRGSPNVIAEIRFDDFEEALHRVRAILARELKVTSLSMAIPG